MILMSSNIYYLGAAGSLASLALGPGIWALVDAATHTRQVCASTSDNDVKNAQILDFAHFATCMIVFALPMYKLRKFRSENGTDDSKKTEAPMIELAYACMFSSFALLVSIVIMSGAVCGNNNCITTNAAQNAQTQDFGVYNTQLVKMLGIEGDGENGSARCGLNPSHFKVPGNYCQENLVGLTNCPNVETPGGAEKCLVFACSNLVEGRQSRFIISLVGLLLQIIATYFVILFEHASTESPKIVASQPKQPVVMQAAFATAPPWPAPGKSVPSNSDELRQRRYTADNYTLSSNRLEF